MNFIALIKKKLNALAKSPLSISQTIRFIVLVCLIALKTSSYANDGLGGASSFEEGAKAFSLEVLQKQIDHSITKNQVISPLGITFLMSMIQHGVGNEDRQEIEKVLHLPKNDKELEESAFNLIDQLKNNGVDIAGLLYLNPKYRLSPEYQMKMETFYQSKAESGSSAEEVNQWAAAHTNGQINKIIEQSDLRNFFILLANAIHFKGDWKVPFKKKKTAIDEFSSPGGVVKVSMMHKREQTGYFEDEIAQAVRLGYKNSECSLVLILPKKENDFSGCDASYFETVLNGFRSNMVTIELPKFSLEQENDVKEILKEMGVNHLFTRPDFTNMIDRSDSVSNNLLGQLQITRMKQKCAFSCNEKGTEVSAVTSAVISLTCAAVSKDEYKQIRFDRPFLAVLMIEDVPLFIAVIRDPSV